MAKIDLEKFICSMFTCVIESRTESMLEAMNVALKDQGLEYNDGQIVEIDKPLEIKTGREKIDKNLKILNSVAEKLIGGQLHTGNVAHDAPTKGYTIKNCVNNIREAMGE